MPSVSMVMRIDKNDEQYQSQERKQDHMDWEKINGFCYLGSQLLLESSWQMWDFDLKSWCTWKKNEQQVVRWW